MPAHEVRDIGFIRPDAMHHGDMHFRSAPHAYDVGH